MDGLWTVNRECPQSLQYGQALTPRVWGPSRRLRYALLRRIGPAGEAFTLLSPRVVGPVHWDGRCKPPEAAARGYMGGSCEALIRVEGLA
jgi:hypothetical protein